MTIVSIPLPLVLGRPFMSSEAQWAALQLPSFASRLSISNSTLPATTNNNTAPVCPADQDLLHLAPDLLSCRRHLQFPHPIRASILRHALGGLCRTRRRSSRRSPMSSTQIWLSPRAAMESPLQRVFIGMVESTIECPARRVMTWILRALQDQETTKTIWRNTNGQ